MTLRNVLALVLVTFSIAKAQVPAGLNGNGKITGVLVDSVSKQPIEFATLAIFKVSNMKQPIDGTITDDKGNFELKNIPTGKYSIRFSFIGYNDKFLVLNELTDKNNNINLGNVILASNVKILNEVVVTGQAALIEEKVDRLVYNAEKDIAAKGGDAADVLRKVPLLTVDLDGNVQLRGSSNIRVLINNKPSTIMAASVADALKQIPADDIKTVEVITSPSAKYDAEGTGGIINIITKKNNIQGYSLNTDIGGGNRGGNLGLNGSLRGKRFGMTLGGYGRFNANPSSLEFEQKTLTLDTNIVTKQNGNARDQSNFGRYSIGADYDISKNKFLTAGARFGTRGQKRDQDLNIVRSTEFGVLSNTLQRIESNLPSINWDFNLDYLHVIKPGKEFSISTLYSRSSANVDFTNTPLDGTGSSLTSFGNKNINLNQEYTVQADYTSPIKKNQIIEFGGKAIFREVNSDFSYLVGGKEVTSPNRPSGSLDYNQNIAAGYFAYTYSTSKKFIYKVGARYEATDISAEQNDAKPIDIAPYSNLVPSLNVSKTFKGKYTVKAGYNRRIQRPGLQQLNPNVNLVNPQSIQIGNPELEPEIADNFETSLSASIKKIYINLSLFARVTDNAISQMTQPSITEPGVLITTYENIGSEKAFGVNWFGNMTITPKWTLSGGIESFYNVFNGFTPGLNGQSQAISNGGFNTNARLFSFVTLSKGWQVQAFSFVRGSRVLPMGRQGGFGFYSLGAKKEFKNKKGSIGMSTQNFLQKTWKVRNSIESPLFTQNSVNNLFNRGISVNISYKIGKSGADTFTPRKRAKGVKNDDVKEGGSTDTSTQPAGGGRPG